jgi:hypothetical protein
MGIQDPIVPLWVMYASMQGLSLSSFYKNFHPVLFSSVYKKLTGQLTCQFLSQQCELDGCIQ